MQNKYHQFCRNCNLIPWVVFQFLGRLFTYFFILFNRQFDTQHPETIFCFNMLQFWQASHNVKLNSSWIISCNRNCKCKLEKAFDEESTWEESNGDCLDKLRQPANLFDHLTQCVALHWIKRYLAFLYFLIRHRHKASACLVSRTMDTQWLNS